MTAKCQYCPRTLPEPETNFVGVVIDPIQGHQVPCCGGCASRKKLKFVGLRMVRPRQA